MAIPDPWPLGASWRSPHRESGVHLLSHNLNPSRNAFGSVRSSPRKDSVPWEGTGVRNCFGFVQPVS